MLSGVIERMINIMDKGKIIGLKEHGLSERKIAAELNVSRKVIRKVWSKHISLLEQLNKTDNFDEIKLIQQQIVADPKYDSSNRKKLKYTKEIDQRVDEILLGELEKDKTLGSTHKQKLSCALIHEMLIEEGFDIGLTTITINVGLKRQKTWETFIRQTYHLGQRLEYDFGEVKLKINGIVKRYYMAVISSPAANHRTAYLYEAQNKKVFLDSHVKFFDEIGGVYEEIVYDNMRNVVSKFIGKNEKELNKDLVKMSIYYGFEINVTNCFSGNEKGYVEGSVKHIRQRVFARKYEFESLEQAREHLKEQLVKLNKNSSVEDEKKVLKAIKPKLEIAEITSNSVNKYSTIRIENNYYSVPEDLCGKEVIVKNYLEDIQIVYQDKIIARHKKIDGYLEYCLDINHYLKTLMHKPGALKNSQALVSNPELKAIYDEYYSSKPKLFIELIYENKHLKKEALNKLLLESYDNKVNNSKAEEKIVEFSKKQISIYNNLMNGVN